MGLLCARSTSDFRTGVDGSRGARSLLSFFLGSLVSFFLGSLVSFNLVSLLSFSSFGSNSLEREVPW